MDRGTKVLFFDFLLDKSLRLFRSLTQNPLERSDTRWNLTPVPKRSRLPRLRTRRCITQDIRKNLRVLASESNNKIGKAKHTRAPRV